MNAIQGNIGDNAGVFHLGAWVSGDMTLGDWGVKRKDNNFVNAGKAKQHVVQILARWQASPAANYFKVAISGSHSPQVPLAATRWLADNIVGRQP